MDKKKSRFNFLTVLALIFSIIGILIFSFYLWQLSSIFKIFGDNQIDMEKTGQFGDYIGGVVGSIWTLVSVLLFYNALELQRQELSHTRKQMQLQLSEMGRQRNEFEINRITSIIYKQLEIIENKQKNIHLVLDSKDINERGIGAIYMFKEILSAIVEPNKEFSDIAPSQQTDFNILYAFFLNRYTREYLNSFEKSIQLCYLLITENQENGQLITENQENGLSNTETRHLMQLLYYNFNLKDMSFFYKEYIRLHQIQHKRIESNTTISDIKTATAYQNQELVRITNIKKIMELIQNATKIS